MINTTRPYGIGRQTARRSYGYNSPLGPVLLDMLTVAQLFKEPEGPLCPHEILSHVLSLYWLSNH